MNSDPTHKTESLERAIQAMRTNRPLVAEEICRDYLLLRPGSLEHLRLLGHSRAKQRRHAEAEAQVRQAFAVRPAA